MLIKGFSKHTNFVLGDINLHFLCSWPDQAPLCWFILLSGHKQATPSPTCLALLGRRDGTRKHRQGPSMGAGTAWAGALWAMGLHPLPEAPQSLGFGAGDGQHGSMCMAYQPA